MTVALLFFYPPPIICMCAGNNNNVWVCVCVCLFCLFDWQREKDGGHSVASKLGNFNRLWKDRKGGEIKNISMTIVVAIQASTNLITSNPPAILLQSSFFFFLFLDNSFKKSILYNILLGLCSNILKKREKIKSWHLMDSYLIAYQTRANIMRRGKMSKIVSLSPTSSEKSNDVHFIHV
jgi:hypothetical protein